MPISRVRRSLSETHAEGGWLDQIRMLQGSRSGMRSTLTPLAPPQQRDAGLADDGPRGLRRTVTEFGFTAQRPREPAISTGSSLKSLRELRAAEGRPISVPDKLQAHESGGRERLTAPHRPGSVPDLRRPAGALRLPPSSSLGALGDISDPSADVLPSARGSL
jgi:hypothetical protein